MKHEQAFATVHWFATGISDQSKSNKYLHAKLFGWWYKVATN